MGLGFVLLVGLGIAAFQGWQIVDAIFHAERAAVVPLPTRSGVELGGATSSGANRPNIVPVTESDLTATAEATRHASPVAQTPRAQASVMPNVTVEPTATSGPTIAAAATQTPSPTPTTLPTSTVAPTATSAPAIASVATKTPSPVPTTQPTAPTATTEPAATSTVAPQPTEQPPTPTATETPDQAALAASDPTSTSVPAATATSVSQPTSTPVPTETVVPTATEAPAESTPADIEAEATSTEVGSVADGSGGNSRLDILQQMIGAGLDDGDPGLNEAWGGAETLNILVVGVDRRPDGGDQNSDVIIIAQLDLINKALRAVSIPRDLLVEVPGIGYDKINSAYNYGVTADPENPAAGISMLRDTIEYNFGIPIDHYVMIDFDGFVDVVDSVGGIDVDVPEDLYDPEYPTVDYGVEEIFFPAGENHMDGETALKYVRTRHQDSDDGRRQRQLDVILAIFEKGKSLGSINKIDDLIFALGDSAQTSFDLEEQLLLARLALQVDEANITMQSLAPPLIWSGTIEATGAWVYTGDWGPIVAFVQEAVNGPAG